MLPAVSRSDYNAVLYIMQCRAPPHVAIFVWRSLSLAPCYLIVGVGHRKPLHIETMPANELKWQICDSSATVRLDVLLRSVESLLHIAAICAKCCGLFEI